MQPGDLITPGASAPKPEEPAHEPASVSSSTPPNYRDSSQGAPSQATQHEFVPASTQSSVSLAGTSSQTKAPAIQQAPASVTAQQYTPTQPDDSVTWTASEYISHQKNPGWYALLTFASLLASIVVFVITRDLVSLFMILLVAIAFGVFAARKPKILHYDVGHSGVTIGQKFYPYENFKSFSVVDEGAMSAIWLISLKRFLPPITMYYAPEDEDRIADTLSQYLPYEERTHDRIDRAMNRLHF